MIRLALLKQNRSNYIKTISCYIPHVLTMLNALCGFIAITRAMDGDCVGSAYCIVLAALTDGCDGFIARALNNCTEFGQELDSLADAVSFCGAPMVLMYQWLPIEGVTWATVLLGLYVCAGLWRLATFNTAPYPCAGFRGLPTTIGALTLALVVIYEPWFSQHINDGVQQGASLILVLLLGVLMLSSISFYKWNKIAGHFTHKLLLMLLFFIALCAHKNGNPVFLMYVILYIAANMTRSLKSNKIGANA